MEKGLSNTLLTTAARKALTNKHFWYRNAMWQPLHPTCEAVVANSTPEELEAVILRQPVLRVWHSKREVVLTKYDLMMA